VSKPNGAPDATPSTQPVEPKGEPPKFWGLFATCFLEKCTRCNVKLQFILFFFLSLSNLLFLLSVPPRIYPSPINGYHEVKSGSDIELVCHAEGSPEPAITWRRKVHTSIKTRLFLGICCVFLSKTIWCVYLIKSEINPYFESVMAINFLN